jgi:erythronate-4-phosphate dehydrogenase
MKIVADCDIPFVKEAFIEFGNVIMLPGREISKEKLKDTSILIVRSVTTVDSNLLEDTSIKFVGTVTSGTDHIDSAYLAENNIGFASAPGSNAQSVAEYVISALLYLADEKKFQLGDMTLGIIGVGNIGTRVFKMAQALGIQCLLNDPPKRRLTGSEFYLPLDEVIEKSDIISIHVPLITEGQDTTLYMVDSDFMSKTKDGLILVNTSRGRIVDEKYVCEIIHKFKGLVFDVWENEPDINLDLLKLVDIGTPHIAGYSYNGKMNGIDRIFKAACAFFFKDGKWNKEKILNKIRRKSIDLTGAEHVFNHAVQSAYPIMDDSNTFKKILDMEKAKRSAFFDELRRKYYKRLEFSHFNLKEDTIKIKDMEILSGLGFILE